MSTKVTARLQTPQDENGERLDVHLITTSDEVIVNAGTGNEMTLTEKLDKIGEGGGGGGSNVVISATQPSSPCIWCRVTT